MQSLLSNLSTKIPKKFTLLFLLDLTFASGREGIDNPFIVLVARFLFVCVDMRDLRVASYWIDTFVLKTEGNTYSTLLHHPFLFKGKTNTSSRGSKKNFWRRCRGGSRKQVNYTKYPPQSLSLTLRYLPFASRFPLPHFTLAVLFALSFRLPLFRLILVCLCVGLLACHDGSR